MTRETKAATTWAAASATIAPFVLTKGIRVERPGEASEEEEEPQGSLGPSMVRQGAM